jgi:hypothetical protein
VKGIETRTTQSVLGGRVRRGLSTRRLRWPGWLGRLAIRYGWRGWRRQCGRRGRGYRSDERYWRLHFDVRVPLDLLRWRMSQFRERSEELRSVRLSVPKRDAAVSGRTMRGASVHRGNAARPDSSVRCGKRVLRKRLLQRRSDLLPAVLGIA